MKMEAQQLLVRTLPLIIAATLSGGFTGNAMAENSTEKDSYLDVGGAIRFNYGWLDYGSTDGIDLELLRADLKAGTGPVSFSAQYRWYDGFDAIHHAWLGWQFTPDTALKAGIQQVPFGLLPTASHSFWFGSGYYLGLEDDYDPGLVLSRQHGSTQWHLGWFSGDEYGDARRYRRYSFDIAATDALPYRERDRVHARIEHRGGDTGSQWLLGASGLVGRLQDIHSRQHHRQYAAAVHAQWQHGPWTTQLQWARYRHDVPGQRIALSAFQAPFEVAAHADVPTANLAYDFGAVGRLEQLTCYNNLSMTRPLGSQPGLRNSWQNVTGCSLHKGPMVTYVDWIAGNNMWFAGGPGIGIDDGSLSRWHSRLNVNIGFYF